MATEESRDGQAPQTGSDSERQKKDDIEGQSPPPKPAPHFEDSGSEGSEDVEGQTGVKI
jgi:hypothetical protein